MYIAMFLPGKMPSDVIADDHLEDVPYCLIYEFESLNLKPKAVFLWKLKQVTIWRQNDF